MTISEWMEREGLTDAEAARAIGVERSSVTRYRAGRIPSREVMELIRAATKGAVTANDFFHREAA